MNTNPQSLEQQLYDIYGMTYVPWWHTSTFYLFCIVLACSSAGIIMYFLIRRYRMYRRHTPWDVALRALNELGKHLRADNSRLFYYTLTDTLKTYLQERYGYSVVNKTDEECVAYLSHTDFPHELQEIVTTLLRASTMSKFASAQAAEHQMREHIELAHDLIKRTIPQRT